jgi:uncharacterized protein YqjF (DUF2071 family)
MSTLSAPRERITPDPPRRPIGHHRWSNLLFIHWRLPAEAVGRLIPRELTLDTWEGDAFVGLVAFQLSGVRPWWSPAVPGVSSFCETNVRTYVRHRDGEPAVWFFSLDAARSLAVRVARWKWSLPYYRAEMEVRRSRSRIAYASRRLWPGPAGAMCRIEAKIGESAGGPAHAGTPEFPRPALPGTLNHFLIERYVLYAQAPADELLTARVVHVPYPLRPARVDRLEETLLSAAGIVSHDDYCHTTFCDGVDVDILPLLPAN